MTGEEAHSRTDDDGKPLLVQMARNFLPMVLDRGVTPIIFEHLRNLLPTVGGTSATLPYQQKRRDLYFLVRSTRGVLPINLRGDIPGNSFLPGTTDERVTGNRAVPTFGAVSRKEFAVVD